MAAHEPSHDGSLLGICLRPEYDDGYSLERMRELALLADVHGFHSVWLAESWGLDAVTLLADIGAHTRRVALGTAIVSVFSRTPAGFAMAAATLAHLYEGRVILGLGASTKALVEKWHGVRFDRPLARLRDTVCILRQILAGQTVSYRGEVFSVDGYHLRVPPPQPSPPIYLAGLGPTSRGLVGELADGWLPYLIPLRGLASTVAEIRNHASRSGRSGDAIRIAPLITTAVAEDSHLARERARQHIAFYLGAMGPHYRGFVASFGFEEETKGIAAAWREGDRSGAFRLVSDEMLRELAIAGSPDECAEQLARWRSAGAELPILFFPGRCSSTMVELAVRVLSPASNGQGT